MVTILLMLSLAAFAGPTDDAATATPMQAVEAGAEVVAYASSFTVTRSPTRKLPAAAEFVDRSLLRCSVDVVVDAKGRPSQIIETDCHELLGSWAESMFMKWRFAPHLVDGVPTPMRVKVEYRDGYDVGTSAE